MGGSSMDEPEAGLRRGEGELMQEQVPADSSPHRDWSELPADLLVSVFVAMDVLDLFSVRAVCRSWHFGYLVARRLGTCCKNYSPCLLYSSKDSDPNTATLCRLTNNKLYRVVLPDPPFRSRFVVGSSRGWLATADEQSQLFLVNPITGDQVALPPPLTIKNVRGCYNTEGVLESYQLLELDLTTRDCDTQDGPDDLTLERGCLDFYLRVAMSADPSSGDCIVMIMHMPWNHLSFSRIGDTHWTWIDVDQRCFKYNDFFYNDSDGLFYAVRESGEVHSIDLNGPSPVVKAVLRPITSLINNDKYIVQAPWGDILQVWRYYWVLKEGVCRTVRLVVYLVDLAQQKLVETNYLQEHALFIGFNTPFFLLADDYPMLTPNCIYMTVDNMDYIYSEKFGSRQVVVFNMKDGSFTDLFPDGNSWLNWPLPIWITPSYSEGNNGQLHMSVPN
ncbi:hypothetical protein ACP70R_029994 [Stipagrostis hirtigluma subsp. patula]